MTCPTDVESTVIRCLARTLLVDPGDLSPAVPLREYAVDSLDVMEFCFDLGERLGCKIDPTLLDGCRTVGDVVRRVEGVVTDDADPELTRAVGWRRERGEL
jgi:acyl carrier protein